jgi:hypothetical protein
MNFASILNFDNKWPLKKVPLASGQLEFIVSAPKFYYSLRSLE